MVLRLSLYQSTDFSQAINQPTFELNCRCPQSKGERMTRARQDHEAGYFTYTPVEVTCIMVDPIKKATVNDIKTSLYTFSRLLDQVNYNLKDACSGVGRTSRPHRQCAAI